MINNAIEDFKRYQEDHKANSAPQKVLPNPMTHPIQLVMDAESKDVKVWQVFLIEKDQTLPADVIVLATSCNFGMCYVSLRST